MAVRIWNNRDNVEGQPDQQIMIANFKLFDDSIRGNIRVRIKKEIKLTTKEAHQEVARSIISFLESVTFVECREYNFMNHTIEMGTISGDLHIKIVDANDGTALVLTVEKELLNPFTVPAVRFVSAEDSEAFTKKEIEDMLKELVIAYQKLQDELEDIIAKDYVFANL